MLGWSPKEATMQRVLLATLAVGALGFGPLAAEANARTVSASISTSCASRQGAIVVSPGKKAFGFRVLQLRNGVKCHGVGRADSRGWGITRNGRRIYYWSQWRQQPRRESGGPLGRLQLGPGRYQVFVDGGRGALAQISYQVR